VVPFALGRLADPVREYQGTGEIRERKRSLQVVIFHHVPFGNLPGEPLDITALKGRLIAGTGFAVSLR
jgi:hypothetical protein